MQRRSSGRVVGTLLAIVAALAVTILVGAAIFGPEVIERSANRVLVSPPYPVGKEARDLHDRMFVADLHADPLLWQRDLLVRGTFGHVDVPRLIEANVALQVFGVVTQVPYGINYERNAGDAFDVVSVLAVLQRWPVATWTSRTERAIYQAQKFTDVAARSGGRFRLIRRVEDLYAYLEDRTRDRQQTAGMLAIEGMQAIDGKLENVARLRAAGFRMMGIAHFFDNQVGGSAHGTERGGLTDLGRAAVREMQATGIAVDLAHASPQVFDEVAAMTTKPLVVSHAGVKGTCDSPRNLSDAQLRKVAATGGVVGIGYWDGAVCDPSLAGIVKAIRYAIGVAGPDHVGLGSDFDGATATPFDTTGVPRLTEALLQSGLSQQDVAKIMGANAFRVLRANLPSGIEASTLPPAAPSPTVKAAGGTGSSRTP